MGAVFEALDLRLERPVALKVLTSSPVAALHGDLAREAQAASALNHPNIVVVYEIGFEDGVEFIAMERVEGISLLQAIAGRSMPLRDALHIAIQIAAALSAAHESGIVHRDLKPANVMITPRGLVKVLDFGLAQRRSPDRDSHAHDPTVTIADPGRTFGTIAYMSPEQARGQSVDARSDIFAFGSVFYEMLTGRRAFHGDDSLLTLAAVVDKDPRPPREIVPTLPASLERILLHCFHKNRLDRWQSMADIKLLLEAAAQDLAAPAPAPARRRPRRWWPLPLALAAGVLAGVLLYRYWPRPLVASAPAVVRRVTGDAGLTAFPALSHDGNMLAFASDRGGAEHLDIWVQQIGGRDPMRVTSNPADDSDPDFSPDSTRIAFRSERAGGGIYTAPAFGGEELLLAPGGHDPHFSPDGRWIAYWEGRELGGYLPGSARVFVIEPGGGQPRQVATDLSAALHPVWSPRSDSLLVLGRRGAETSVSSSLDWWIVPLAGGPSVPTGALARFRAESLINPAWQFRILPLEWFGENPGHVLFAAGADAQGNRGDTADVWELSLSSTGEVQGLTKVVSGSGYHLQASRADADPRGRLAFSSVDWQLGVWSADLDDPGRPIRNLTESEWYAGSPSLSQDGRVLAFLDQRLGRWAVRTRDLTSGRETSLVAGSPDLARCKISGDGKLVVYATLDGTLFSVPAVGGKVDKICDGCGAVMGVSNDGSLVSYEAAHTNDLMLLDVERRTSSALAPPPDQSSVVSGGQFSPDGKWMAFHTVVTRKSTAAVWIVPVQPGRVVPPSAWIAVSDEPTVDRDPAWSPRGDRIFFTSERDGFRCIWSRPLDPVTKRPSGPAVAVLHFHSARRSLRRISARLENNSLSIAGNRLVFAFGELKGNIWLEERPR